MEQRLSLHGRRHDRCLVRLHGSSNGGEGLNSRIGGNAALRSLLAPLDYLLASGGDTRLHLQPVTLLNGYGCRPFPRPEALTFASTTATSISDHAFAEASAMYELLIDSAVRAPDNFCFPLEVERLRDRLREALRIDETGCEIVFSPSGTDSALHATFLALSVLGRPLVSVVVASDETGSGTTLAVSGRHFSSLTALGRSVTKGEPIEGIADNLQAIGVPLRTRDGAVRSMAEIDEETVRVVSDQVAAGRRVVLHVMDNSKLGCRAPSPECVPTIASKWPDRVQIVVDACQLRLSHRRIGEYLELGYIVQITGSKFFTGPPFSGALLVPPSLSEWMQRVDAVPAGLRDYTARYSWPTAWPCMQRDLPETPNVGEFLRWIAAEAEMRLYFEVPETYRRVALARFSDAVPSLIQCHSNLELLPDYAHVYRYVEDNEEFSERTIFPFLIHCDAGLLSYSDSAVVYRALNQDLSPLLPDVDRPCDLLILKQLCHIGQPVAVCDASGRLAGTLRISAGARVVSETWCPDKPMLSYQKLQNELDQVRLILDKIQLILRHFSQLVHKV